MAQPNPIEHVAQFFRYEHLPEGAARETSKLFAQLVRKLGKIPLNPEATAGLRKLVEAKDCFVRVALLDEDGWLP